MSQTCGKLTAGLIRDICAKTVKSGAANRLILINYDDIDRANCTITNGVLTEIALKSGKVGYMFETPKKAITGEYAYNANTYHSNDFTHKMTPRVLVRDNDALAFMESLNQARIVGILEHNDHGNNGDMKYLVYGWESGLILTEDPGSTDITDGVVYAPVLSSEDGMHESARPMPFFDTDEETTDAAFLALLGTTSPSNHD